MTMYKRNSPNDSLDLHPSSAFVDLCFGRPNHEFGFLQERLRCAQRGVKRPPLVQGLDGVKVHRDAQMLHGMRVRDREDKSVNASH